MQQETAINLCLGEIDLANKQWGVCIGGRNERVAAHVSLNKSFFKEI